MPANPELYDLAIRGIGDYYRDRSVSLTEIRGGLAQMKAEITTLVGALKTETAIAKQRAKATKAKASKRKRS